MASLPHSKLERRRTAAANKLAHVAPEPAQEHRPPDAVSCFVWLRGDLVRTSTGDEVQGSSLFNYGLIGLFFSASWSPPCQNFTEILAEAWHAIRAQHGERAFELVLVPLDTDEGEWRAYSENMPWLSLPVSSRESIMRLFVHFQVSEIPRLVIVNSSGEVVQSNARGRPHGFGFGCEPLAVYAALVGNKADPAAVKDGAEAKGDASGGGDGGQGTAEEKPG